MLIALGNLLTTMVIINVLRIGPEGMEAIEFSTLENAIKFFGNADLGNVYQHNGIISGFAGEELSIIGKESLTNTQQFTPHSMYIFYRKLQTLYLFFLSSHHDLHH